MLFNQTLDRKQAREKVLLLQLKEECTLSDNHWKRFWLLTNKQSANTLNEEEE